MAERYVMRMRTEGIRDDQPIILDIGEGVMTQNAKGDWVGDCGVWDSVEKCFVKKNERGEWVPE